MNRKMLVILGSVVVVFVIAIVGASSLNLIGSDSAPAEGKTVAACAQNLVIKTAVDTSVHDANKINQVAITGDMTQCVGQTMRVEVDTSNTTHAWAVHKITSAITSLTLAFNSTTGDFYDTKPTADSSGNLVVTGSRVGSVVVTDFGLTTVTIAKTWQ